ncbi:MAG TPA: class I SAM-dependent methyltransferase [Thermoplasmata archaeon]|nr:class I SAM-dependent methyltransferase [Thermoplasmata archaeon]
MTRPRSRPRPLPRGARDALEALGDRRASPNLRWLAGLLDEPVDALRPMLSELGELVAYEAALRAQHRAAGRSFFAQFRAPFELYLLVRRARPAHVVETGVSSGVSSMHILLALRANGRGTLHSVDRPIVQRAPALGRTESAVAVPPGRSSGWAVPPSLARGWDLRLGASETVLPALVDELPSVDLFLHDSHHTPAHLAFELGTIRPKLPPGAVVLADNTVWTGAAFPRFARRLRARVVRRGRSDLVGLRVPGTEPTGGARRTTRRPARRSRSSR